MVKHLVHRKLAQHVDKAAIERAIEAAELQTSGQIRVSLAPHFWGDVRRTAERAFERMGMTATPHRNAVLFFVVPGRRKFVVLGDAGIHEKVGQEFWEQVTAAVSEKFRAGDLTGGSSTESKRSANNWRAISHTIPVPGRACQTRSISRNAGKWRCGARGESCCHARFLRRDRRQYRCR
jgi:hypothetical protein